VYTYYFIENGEVLYISQFKNEEEAISYQKDVHPNSTLAVKVNQ
jgi:hypothetical protein